MKFIIIGLSLLLFSDNVLASSNNQDKQSETNLQIILDVYKSPSCGCCEGWMEHLHTNQIKTVARHPENMSEIKRSKGIAPQFQSCHTGVSKEGYIFEGHIPAKYIQKFIKDKPKNAIGLSVPAMPMGSPGMEYQDKFMPYKVLLLKSDGSYEIYAEVKTKEEQY